MIPRKTVPPRKISLNLNIYRNLHYKVKNQIKQAYTKIFEHTKLKLFKLRTPIKIKYQLYVGTRRLIDSMNVYCIIDKFFCDTLVRLGCIPDDNDKYIEFKLCCASKYEANKDICEIIIEEQGDIKII